jgi:hypothetical protein
MNASIFEPKKVDKVLPASIRDVLSENVESWSKENLIKLGNQNTMELLNNSPPSKYMTVSPGA